MGLSGTVFAAALVLALAATSPAAAQSGDPLTTVTDPEDRAVMEEVAAAIAMRSPDLARLDAALAKLPRPTPMRGLVQTIRAAVLFRQDKDVAAVAAVEEALRLLPDEPGPKLVAAEIFTFNGAPARAADLWLQASRDAPELAQKSHSYVMGALVGRLRDNGDSVRADRVRARMGEIGFASARANERSSFALARTREAVAAGRLDDARASVIDIVDPTDLVGLYLDRRYEFLWPRIAEWSGPDLADQSRRYLEVLRAEWSAGDSFATATAYARELIRLDAVEAVIGLFLPKFERAQPFIDVEDQGEMLYLAPTVARALASAGRKAEAEALLDKARSMAPANDKGNVLNLDGSAMLLAANDADWPATITRADAFLARAAAFPGTNRSAIVHVKSLRACALARVDRIDEARADAADVLRSAGAIPGFAMQMHLCRGDGAAARALLLAGFKDETNRGWALRFVQPPPGPPQTALER